MSESLSVCSVSTLLDELFVTEVVRLLEDLPNQQQKPMSANIAKTPAKFIKLEVLTDLLSLFIVFN